MLKSRSAPGYRRLSAFVLVLMVVSLINWLPGSIQMVSAADSTTSNRTSSPEAALVKSDLRVAQPSSVSHLPSLVLHLATEPAYVAVGDDVTLTLTVENQAVDAAKDLVIKLPLPDGTEAAANEADYQPDSKTWEWKLEQLKGGEQTIAIAHLKVTSLPKGEALLAHYSAMAQGLSLPVQEVAGAVVFQSAATLPLSGNANGLEKFSSKTKDNQLLLESADQRVTLSLPAGSTKLGLRYTTLPEKLEALKKAEKNIPSQVAGFKRNLGVFFVEETLALQNEAEKGEKASATPVGLTVHYTDEQLAALHLNANTLSIFSYDEATQQWQALPTDLDLVKRTATTKLSSMAAGTGGLTLGDASSPSEAFVPSLKDFQTSLYTGSASYNVSLDLPAGPNGLKPNLGISYNSAATDGDAGRRVKQQSSWVGKGWSFGPGSVDRFELSNDYGFSLDANGISLDLTRGAALVANANKDSLDQWEWTSTNEDFTKVKAVWIGGSVAPSVPVGTVSPEHSSDDLSFGRGGKVNGNSLPRYKWVLWAKDGTRYEFADDLWYGWNYCVGKYEFAFVPYKWQLSTITDASNNAIRFKYGRQTVTGNYQSCDSSNSRSVQGTIDRDAWLTEVLWNNDLYRLEVWSGARPFDTAFDYSPLQYGGVNGPDQGAPRETRYLQALRTWVKVDGTYKLRNQYTIYHDTVLYPDVADCTSYTATPATPCGPNQAYPKLSLSKVERVSKDANGDGTGENVLPPTTFAYHPIPRGTQENGDGWMRLSRVSNNKGGVVFINYENIYFKTGNNRFFLNRNRVVSRTASTGKWWNSDTNSYDVASFNKDYTWTYSYTKPAVNNLGYSLTNNPANVADTDKYLPSGYDGDIFYAARNSQNEFPNSAVLYYAVYQDTSSTSALRQMRQAAGKEFRGHEVVTETTPEGNQTVHYFKQGGANCYPGSPGAPIKGSPTNGYAAILNDSCFQQLRDSEFLKGKEWKTEVKNAAADTIPLKSTEHVFGADFLGYGNNPNQGSWRNFVYETTTLDREFNGSSVPALKSTTMQYDNCVNPVTGALVGFNANTTVSGQVQTGNRYGNLCRIEEFNTVSTKIRTTYNWYAVRDTIPAGVVSNADVTNPQYVYIVDRKSATRVHAGNGNMQALSYNFYDGNVATWNAAGAMGLKGRLTGVATFRNVPDATTYPANYDLKGQYIAHGYDSWGNQTSSTTYSDELTYHTATGSFDLPTQGRTSTNTYDSTYHSFLISQANALGHVVNATYDYQLGTMTGLTNANNNITQAGYDNFGRMITIIKPGDSPAQPTLNIGSMDYERPARFLVQTKGRDAVKNDPYHESSSFFDGLGRVIQTKDEETGYGIRSIVSEKEYGSTGNVTKDSQTRWTTDIWYNYSDPYNTAAPGFSNPTLISYDGVGRVKQVDFPDGTNIRHNYAVANMLGRGHHAVHQVFDQKGNITETWTDSLGQFVLAGQYDSSFGQAAQTQYEYNPLGQLTKVSDPKGNQTQIWYDSMGRKTALQDPDMGYWQYTYNGAGNLASQTDAKNQKLVFTYDALDRLTLKQDAAGNVLQGFAYDDIDTPNGKGKLTSMLDKASGNWANFKYDANENIIQSDSVVKGILKTLKWEYDTAGHQTSITYPDGEKVTLEYDSMSRPYSACNVSGGVCYIKNASYAENNQPGQWTFGNNQVQNWTYSGALRQLNRFTVSSGGPDWSYAYDQVGNISSIKDNLLNQTRAYSYDHRNQLTTSQVTDSRGYVTNNTSFSYDILGNLTSKTENVLAQNQATPTPTPCGGTGGPVLTAACPDSNKVVDIDASKNSSRLAATLTAPSGYHYDTTTTSYTNGVTVNGVTTQPHQLRNAGYTYDANGNLLSDGTWTYTWDSQNQLLAADSVRLNVHETYTYNANGERVTRTTNGVVKMTLTDLWEETIGGSNVAKNYYFAGKLVARRDATGLNYLFTDHQGSVIAAFNPNAGWTGNKAYDAWGNKLAATGNLSATPRGYTGQEEDASGLVYLHSRYYNPGVMRFLSGDAIVPGTNNLSLTVDYHEVDLVVRLNVEMYDTEEAQQAGSTAATSQLALNRYSYVANNPANATDITGHAPNSVKYDSLELTMNKQQAKKFKQLLEQIIYNLNAVIEQDASQASLDRLQEVLGSLGDFGEVLKQMVNKLLGGVGQDGIAGTLREALNFLTWLKERVDDFLEITGDDATLKILFQDVDLCSSQQKAIMPQHCYNLDGQPVKKGVVTVNIDDPDGIIPLLPRSRDLNPRLYDSIMPVFDKFKSIYIKPKPRSGIPHQ